MEEESELSENNGSFNSNPTSSAIAKMGLRPLQNCTTTSIQQQQSLPNFFSRNNRTVIAQPQTIPPTPPPSSKDLSLGGPLSSPMLQPDENLITSRTQLLNVNQMVRQQSDTTNNRRLIRSAAICVDDRPATSSNTDSQVSFFVNFTKFVFNYNSLRISCGQTQIFKKFQIKNQKKCKQIKIWRLNFWA